MFVKDKYHKVKNNASLTQGRSEQNDLTIAVIGKGMLKNNVLLSAMLKAQVIRWYPWHTWRKHHEQLHPLPTFAGWGRKKSQRRASRVANKLKQPIVTVEDGFLRSIDSGIHSRYGCSVVVDTTGIYFDAHQPNDLEHLIIKRMKHWGDTDAQRANQAMAQILSHRLSKYNAVRYCPDLSELAISRDVNLNKSLAQHILVVDQVVGDASIGGAGATEKTFITMLKTACELHPNGVVWVKTHPAKAGYLAPSRVDKFIKRLPKSCQSQVQVLDMSVNAIALLKQVSDVYTVSSHMGFEALMLSKTVHCFGLAWYAGWGLTNDNHLPKKLAQRVSQRRQAYAQSFGGSKLKKPNLAQLFYASYIDYSRYADPASKQACELEQVIHWLFTNARWHDELPATMTIYEFSRWKLPFVRDFLTPMMFGRQDANKILTIKPKPRWRNWLHPNHVLADINQDVLVWGLKQRQKLENKRGNTLNSSKTDANIWCMEDGFIRSNGLGATLLAPLSVVLDKTGIYYDATCTSDLERLLANCPPLSETQVLRVEALRHRLLTMKVSKYNVGQSVSMQIPARVRQTHTSVILIVGQVEDDLSVQHCLSPITTNAELIRAVRQAHSEAYLIYKPHPDVEAGLRTGKVGKKTLKLVDDVARDVAMPDCLAEVDAVHTISSLTGFEALLRGLSVTCYGLPFYAGWGLTQDQEVINGDEGVICARQQVFKRRNRQYIQQGCQQQPLTLNQLIHTTLIDYPLYRLPNGYGLAQVEQVIDYLYDETSSTPTACLTLANQEQEFAKPDGAKTRLVAKRFMQTRHQALSLKRRIFNTKNKH